MVEFIRSNFPDAIASPAQKSSRSFDLSSSVGVTDPATPSGSLLGWSQVMSDSFVDTQKKFSKRIQEGRACHTLLPSLHRLEKVANSPSQGKELIVNPDVLDLLKNKVPDFRHLPISVKEGMALERTLRSIMESEFPHLVCDGAREVPSFEEPPAKRRPSHLTDAEIFFESLQQCGFWNDSRCGFPYNEVATTPSVTCRSFSL